MEAAFWQHRWQVNQIGFHLPNANPLLTDNFSRLELAANSKVFIPLCGKTLDIHWLLAQGFRVIAVELVESAIVQLFSELGITPSITKQGKFTLFEGPNIEVWVGDIFDIDHHQLVGVDAIYDRAALVALPVDMRTRYIEFVTSLCQFEACPMLLVSFDYDQTVVGGPPFSIGQNDVEHYYHSTFDIDLIQTADVEGGMKGKCPALEHVFVMRPKTR